MKKIRITWKKSGINRLERHKRTIKALGLHKLYQTVEHEATPQILGMAHAVRHLVEVEQVGG
jgi:large subunit ribosomal protein L30